MTGSAGWPPAPGRLRILSGGRAGGESELLKKRIVVGRSPDADVRLDAELDLAVSALHAELRWGTEGWSVRDLGSRNGTFLNGVRVERETPIAEGDVLRLGADGPELRLVEGSEGEWGTRAAGTETRIGTAVGSPQPPGASTSPRVSRRIAAASVLVLAVVASTSALLYRGHRDRAALEAERDRLHAAVDSLLHREDQAVRELEGELQTLAETLERSRTEVERLRGEVTRREVANQGNPDELLALQRELEEATQALALQQIAAGLDFQRIEGANRSAVVLVFVETEDGRVVTGTGFAVRDDATLVTARHLLEDATGTLSPRRVAVQFSDSDQVWPARVLAVSSDTDLAVVRAERMSGTVPVVQRVNPRPDTVQSGRPVALLGFPLGGSVTAAEAAGGRRPPARPLLSAGVVREAAGGWIEIQGFGDAGASGSPVFDAAGEVIAVVHGGERSARRGVIAAVPSDLVLDLLERAGIR